MLDRMIFGDTLPQAYHHALWVLNHRGEIIDCTDYNTRCKEISVTLYVGNPLKEPMISRCIPGGAEALQQYVMEMLDGIMDFEVERGKWAYTYHQRMTDCKGKDGISLDQVRFVINELRNNPTSRRAVIDVRSNADDMYSDDPACLQHIQYFIRPSAKYPNGQLNCCVLFRSNDAVRATFMNAFALIMLQKRIADALGVPVGTYVHRANSFHAYEASWPLLQSFCESIDAHNRPLTYSYAEEWREQMEGAVPDILGKVENLRSK